MSLYVPAKGRLFPLLETLINLDTLGTFFSIGVTWWLDQQTHVRGQLKFERVLFHKNHLYDSPTVSMYLLTIHNK